MELAATAAQMAALVNHSASAADGVLLVTEDRSRPVRMRRHLPCHWVTSRTPGSLGRFEAVAAPGEHLHFQLALFAAKTDVSIIRADFSAGLAPLAPLCINLEGSDYYGRPYVPSDDARRVARGDCPVLLCGDGRPRQGGRADISGQRDPRLGHRRPLHRWRAH